MDFYPIMTYSYGTLTTNTYNITDTGSTTLISSVSKNLNVYGPKKQQTTKLPDGVYTVKESTTLPNY
ncbi:hypothetical protein QE450_004473 [Paenibacillus sp. SORGH_AS306]|uniref:hypothetical protein n=1 Tax=unclassified Paenibacillus TaxID=185978 RepID=UPI002787BBB7|nr:MULTISPECIES: hypothetical protein [unclassified Paenibacillus]MDQ1236975.1 hypothetical protein [Paenibacillus sp. SORGH_AS_0306]MDR6109336.1 hypothetical protein [Paenibacillus sp. SORGH_AS_0338]